MERTRQLHLTAKEVSLLLNKSLSYSCDVIARMNLELESKGMYVMLWYNIIVKEYDFNSDPAGEIIWYRISKEEVDSYPIILRQPKNLSDMLNVVETICQQFKKLVEDNGLWCLLYDGNNPKHESAAQLLFYGIADAYCTANNIDLSREVNNGHGPVDFKLSIGKKQKVLVEVKLTSNPQLLHGLKKQLPIYMSQEDTKQAIYLVIDNGYRKRLDSFEDYYNSVELKKRIKSNIFLLMEMCRNQQVRHRRVYII